MNPIAMAPLAVADAGPLEQIRAAVAAGFDAMGLRIAPAHPEYDLIGNHALRREAAALLRDTGMRLLETGNVRLDPHHDIRDFLPLLEVGRELGAEHVLVTGTDSGERPFAFKNFGALCELCATLDLKPMIEFVSYRSIASLDQAQAIIADAGHANAGICVDPLHLSRSGSSPRALADCNPRLFPYAHFCDARTRVPNARTVSDLQHESVHDRLYPGEGALWLDEFLDALPAGLPLNVEAPRKAHAHLSPAERATEAAQATRRFLQRYYHQRAVASSR
jgi:sugar phosphate isomerase/epimerase